MKNNIKRKYVQKNKNKTKNKKLNKVNYNNFKIKKKKLKIMKVKYYNILVYKSLFHNSYNLEDNLFTRNVRFGNRWKYFIYFINLKNNRIFYFFFIKLCRIIQMHLNTIS